MPSPQPILVAFDQTPGADAALDEAAYLASALGAPLELVYVWQPPLDLTPLEVGVPRPSTEEMEAAAEDRARRLRDRGVPSVRHRVEFGDPAKRLAVLGGSGRYRMVAVGTHGRTGFARLALGSIAEQVVRGAVCPVLTVRRTERPAVGEAPARTKRILVATDFSPAAGAAVERAVELAKKLGASIELLHAWEPPPLIDGPGVLAAWVYDDSAARAALEEQKREVEKRGVAVTARFEPGVAVDRILHAAVERRPDLLLLGTHGRSGIRRLMLGSVAERVVRRAPCPVLTVHAPPERAGIGMRRDLRLRFEEAAQKLPGALAAEGFTSFGELDLGGARSRRYRVVAACDRAQAEKMLSVADDAGALAPCTLALFEREDGCATVVAADPLYGAAAADPALRDVAAHARDRLARALDRLE